MTTSNAGRKGLGIPLKTICDTLINTGNINRTAQYLHCSRAYIYRELKNNAMEVSKGIWLVYINGSGRE